MLATFRPLSAWGHPETPRHSRRGRFTFRAGWQDTMNKLDYEITRLRGSAVVIGAFFEERDLRLDGLPRSDAREPRHPGIEVSFDSLHGRLVYATDVCDYWQHNVRSIALGLQALRDVDRYGISARGQQYAGWKMLAAGPGDLPTTVEQATALISELVTGDREGMSPDDARNFIKDALKASHPDTGGDPDTFRKVQAARQLLDA